MSFDDLVTYRIGFGKYQKIAIAILVMVDLNDGVQLVLMSFTNPVIQHEWSISSLDVATLTSLFYLGTAVGSCITGIIADRYGRKISIRFSSFALFFVSILFYLVDSFFWMGFMRILYGFTYGFSLPLTTSMLSEIIPIQYRGKGLVFLNLFVSFGKLLGCLLAMACLDSFKEGNWRLMMAISSIPSIFVFIFSSIYLYESPRFLMANGTFEESFRIINAIIKINFGSEALDLSEEEKQNLKNWSHSIINREHQGSILALLNEEHIGVTIRMWIVWFMENAMYFGQLAIMPFILGVTTKSFSNYMITILGETPSFIVSFIIIDHPLLGRKNSLTICFGFSMVLHLLCYMNGQSSFLSLFTSTARFFMKLCYAMLYPFSTEAYPTLLRTVGFGMCGGVGRVGATVIPYLIFWIIEIDLYSPFLVFACTSMIAMIASYTFPFCTLGRMLDHIPNKNHPLPHHIDHIEKQISSDPDKSEEIEMQLILKLHPQN